MWFDSAHCVCPLSITRTSRRCFAIRSGRCAIEGEKDWRCFRIYMKQGGELRHDLPLHHCIVTADEAHHLISVDFYKERTHRASMLSACAVQIRRRHIPWA